MKVLPLLAMTSVCSRSQPEAQSRGPEAQAPLSAGQPDDPIVLHSDESQRRFSHLLLGLKNTWGVDEAVEMSKHPPHPTHLRETLRIL